jgi:hypothetical protein
MSDGELAALESLLMKALPDPMGFLERVLGELTSRLATPTSASGPTVVPSFEAADHDALVDRSVLLAAALGACSDCWGEDPGCPDCGGEGAAGWMPPDPELYAEYVAPSARRSEPMSDHTEGASR